MDDDGNIKISTLIVGIAIGLALTALGGLIAEAFFPRLFTWAFVPGVIFALIYVSVHGHRARSRR